MDPDPGTAALQRFPSPFRINSACAKVFNQLVRMFLHSSFRFRLPWISEVGWNTIRGNIPESERLEFLGDLAIGDKIGNLLYFMHPTGTPGDYTQVKSVLTCNAFFAQIMYRLGHVRDGEGLKEVADAFEIVIGLYHMESGSRALEDWVWENFSPLAEAALDIYETTKRANATHRTYFLSERYIQSKIPSRRERLGAMYQPRGSGSAEDPFILD